MRRSVFLFLAVLVLAHLVQPPAAIAASHEPRAVVERFHGALLAVMKEGEALGAKGRIAKLDPEVTRAFDLPRMIRIATGSFWRAASKDDRHALTQAFQRLSVGTYASHFKSFSGEAFETLGDGPGPRKTMLVRTQIVRGDGPPVPITYVLIRASGGDGLWNIADVLLDNAISELAVKRSEYSRILKNDGVGGLIDVLNEKADQLTAQ